MKFLIKAIFSLVIITGCHQVYIKHIQYPDTVIDPVGAGDSLLSYAALSYKASKSNLIASILQLNMHSKLRGIQGMHEK